ncbi:MAG: sulfotransferase family protein [Planctomycetota bacterium JB042]
MSQEPTPLHWRNVRRWLRKTRRVDDERYEGGGRRLSPGRLLRSAWPRLGRPLFVVGAPRSGTSFLGDAIGALPEFSYHYEPPITKAAARYVYEGTWSEPKARVFYRSAYRWLLRRHLDGDLRFCEKTPQNCFVIDFLDRTFEGAQFLHIVRDGRDAALSYREKPWLAERARDSGKREAGGYLHGPYPRFWVEPERRAEFQATTDLHRCIWAWRRHVEAALAQGSILPEERYLEVRYEALVAAPREEGRRILDFLGVEEEASRAALTARLERARSDSVGRWLRELAPEEGGLVRQEAGSLLARLGYLGGERDS